MKFEIKAVPGQTLSRDAVLHLYESVGWTNYTNRPERLMLGLEKTLCVLAAFEGEKLVGLLRAVGDGQTILFVQDILVLPEYQRQGIGRGLMQTLLDSYPDVYQIELMTDNTEKTCAFYQAMGFVAADKIECRAFLRMHV